MLAPVLGLYNKKKKRAMSPSSTVRVGQHDTKHVRLEMLSHVAFVADEIWGDTLEPSRTWVPIKHAREDTHPPGRISEPGFSKVKGNSLTHTQNETGGGVCLPILASIGALRSPRLSRKSSCVLPGSILVRKNKNCFMLRSDEKWSLYCWPQRLYGMAPTFSNTFTTTLSPVCS